jgi:hypothetical protein
MAKKHVKKFSTSLAIKNESQNYVKVLPMATIRNTHTYTKKKKTQQMLAGIQGKRNHHTLLVEM